MRYFLIFINPISGTKNKDKVLSTIQSILRKNNFLYEIIHTNAENNYDFLKSKIEKENVTDCIVCGGDGTVNQISNAIKNLEVNIGIIPMGSGNGLALAAGISKNVNKAMQIILKGNSSWVDGFLVNDKFCCMLAGLGFDALVAHEFAKQPNRGLITYSKQVLRHFFTAPNYMFNLNFDKHAFSTEAFFISIANSNQFGNNFTIAPKASLNDGLLDIVVVKKMSKVKTFWALLKQLKFGKAVPYNQKKFHKHNIVYFQCKELFIENIQMAPLHFDGDPIETSAFFNIKILPNSFKLLQ